MLNKFICIGSHYFLSHRTLIPIKWHKVYIIANRLPYNTTMTIRALYFCTEVWQIIYLAFVLFLLLFFVHRRGKWIFLSFTIPQVYISNNVQSQNWSGLTSLVAQMVKCLSTMWETWVRSLGREDLLEKEMAIHSSTITWKIPWTQEPGRLQSIGSQRVGHDWATSLHILF